MKSVIVALIACCSLFAVASEKVDALWKFIKEHENVDATSPEGDKICNEIEAMRNALSADEKKEFAQKVMASVMEKMTAIAVDTPSAKVDFFVDDTNSVDSVFGVPFGTKVDKELVTPGSDAGPMALVANETKLKIPKPVKWFTTATGQPDVRNKRIYSLLFKAELPDSMPEDEIQKGVKQLEQLMKAKFGEGCFNEMDAKRDFVVSIIDSKKLDEEISAKYPKSRKGTAAFGVKRPRSLTLHVENRRICKLDPEIPEPKDGDGFADDLKIPEGLELAVPEPYDDNEKKAESAKADFKLFDGSQGGIYTYRATVSIEEDGEVYLRAYEVTKGTRLSADRIKQRTLEKVTGKGERAIGVGKKFTIFEGDWGKYYAARLEIWFVPANGRRPRKLKEKLFKVQGWMF